jgi:hypothetical protein
MADMMSKALEEQAAMQAEMDRQMASLDVRLPASLAAHACPRPDAHTRSAAETRACPRPTPAGAARGGARMRATIGVPREVRPAYTRRQLAPVRPCDLVSPAQMIGTDSKAPASNGSASDGCYEANYPVSTCCVMCPDHTWLCPALRDVPGPHAAPCAAVVVDCIQEPMVRKMQLVGLRDGRVT